MYFITTTAILFLCFIYYKRNHNNKVITYSVLALTLLYLLWRFTAVPHGRAVDFTAGIVLLGAELIGLTQFISFLWIFSAEYHLDKKSLKDYGDKPLPTVDILICTYNEPLDLLKKTIIAAQAVKYQEDKKSVYVCDDGRRQALKQLCGELGVHYLSRPDNQGAKAGNINHALNYTQGRLFAVLDADMLPMDNFLEETVGYFSNPKTAFVQTPQAYYNQDMYQYNLNKQIPNEQDFFMRDIQAARSAHNAVLHVGTNAVFSKEHVLSAGGYPTCSITEDMALGMLLQEKGYDSVFVKEVLAVGLSATTYSELLAQRDRWCRGNLQVIKHHNPLKSKTMSFSQKLAYVDGVIYWCTSIQKMIFLIAPLLYLLLGIKAIDADVITLAQYFLPCFLGQIMAFRTLSSTTRKLYWSHIYETAMAPHISVSIMKELLGFKTGFHVTPKSAVLSKRVYQFKAALPHLVLLLLTVGAWSAGAYKAAAHIILPGALVINLIWSTYNGVALFQCCRLAYQKPILRETERIEMRSRHEVTVSSSNIVQNCILRDISDKGSLICLEDPCPWKEGDCLVIDLEGMSVPAKAVRIDGQLLAVEFYDLTMDMLRKIMKLYMDNIHEYYMIA